VFGAASAVGGNTVIDCGGGDSITLQGIAPGQLNAGDFLF
jgi:hypothetical protein